ncbi:LuxR C-terminal-related transcriptional regulator [Streptomyces rubradiris]|uniref:helix-turn-helix transcriptional regulator n=1 Tax=Streptomyces rubradiris TaxID=285531 RepID=UPI0033CCA79C
MLLHAYSEAENSHLNSLSELAGKQRQALELAAEHADALRFQLAALALHSTPAELSAESGVEEIADPARVRDLLNSVPAMARNQIRIIQPSVVARHVIADWLTNSRSAHDEDIDVRTIHQSTLLQSERGTTYLERLARRGVHVRVASLVPFRLILVDETFALVCPPQTTLLIRQPALLRLLARVFEFCWDGASDLHRPPAAAPSPQAGPRTGDISLSDQQLVVLRLWAKGRQDTDIARELQVSPRTLRRTVSSLLRRLGVNSRFEAGVVATRANLLTDAAHTPAHR